ncbi:hypothetical protein [Campylobacter concisus]|uniref:hypothetical protein n=1 Tax=Campylobacter concisus TaxID=199 RepID=UPI000CD9E708|nr:hypothetical protein [Campylobacter concisus]
MKVNLTFLNLGQIYLPCKFCQNAFELPKFKIYLDGIFGKVNFILKFKLAEFGEFLVSSVSYKLL